ncbi:MAG: aminoglycoside phosphotransferase family protein [Legionella sp.]|nr:aminoglycoside phosphotransferase family protein [Legionella sp.]
MESEIPLSLAYFLKANLNYQEPILEKVSENQNGAVYIVSDIGEKKCVIKLLNANNLCKAYSSNRSLEELEKFFTMYLALYSQILQDFPVPKVIRVHDNYVQRHENYIFYLTSFINGDTRDLKIIDLNQKLKIAKFLSQIHQFDVSSYQTNYWNIKIQGLAAIWEQLTTSELPLAVEGLAAKFVDNDALPLFIRKICSEATPDAIVSQGAELSLVHTDIKPKNVLWDDQQIYVLDWEDMCLARPEIEFVETVTSWAVIKEHHRFTLDRTLAVQFKDAYNRKISISEIDILLSGAKWVAWIVSCMKLNQTEPMARAFLMLHLFQRNYDFLLSLK